MVTIDGRLMDPQPMELVEPVPPGEDSIQVRLIDTRQTESTEVGLLTHNPAFDFLGDEPDPYKQAPPPPPKMTVLTIGRKTNAPTCCSGAR